MAGREGGKPIESSMIARVVAGVRYVITGDSSFFGPGQPLEPQAQEPALGRRFDYPVGTNTQQQPRATEAIDFPTLRALADAYDLVRLAIETRKDQMGKLRWTVQRKDGQPQDATAKAIETFLQEPDRENDFLTWKRQLLEDLLVIDAPTVYVRRTKGGQPFALEVVDGATIKRLLDGTGRTPQPPDPAYQQVLKGMAAVDYSRDELLYQPRNPRPHKVYGYSPVEQMIATVNIALRRQVSQLEYYTEGNIPDMFAGVPANWTPKQVAEFQTYWDELLRGDTGARRRVKFLPGDLKIQLTQSQSLFDMYDEWLARVVSYAFNLPPTAFVKQQNRATAESAQDVALEEGLSPLMEWDVRFMNRLIRMAWQTTDYEFAWVKDLDVDPLVQAQIDEIYTRNKVRRVNEIRADHGWEADEELETAQLAPPDSPFSDLLGAGGEAPAAGAPTAPVPASTPDGAASADGQHIQVTQATVLNGTQISSAKDIIVAVAAGQLPRDTGVSMLQVFFNLTPEKAEQIMGTAGTKTPTTPNPIEGRGTQPDANDATVTADQAPPDGQQPGEAEKLLKARSRSRRY